METVTERGLSAYQRTYRRLIFDMEIPAFDERFLSQYDPAKMGEFYASVNTAAVQFHTKTLSGWCLWPTKVGEMHPALRGRDMVAAHIATLERHGIAVAAYYGSIFDNWAFARNPGWRIVPVQGWVRNPADPANDRHGVCCPNSPGYRDYIAAQAADLFERYEFEIAFVDMTFWPCVCGCQHCRERLGAELPEKVDWADPRWAAFQNARQQWMEEYTGFITDTIKRASPGIFAYHNFGPVMKDWWRAQPATVARHQDTLGGDFYGDETEQLIVMKMMNNLAATRPVEFVTFATRSSREHVELKRPEELRGHMLSAAAESTAFLWIDALDIVGTPAPNAARYITEAFETMVPYEPHLGGDPIEDVAVYFSSESRLSFDTNGTPLSELRPPSYRGAADFPHMTAIRGACRALRRAHIPFGIITRDHLDRLDRYRAIVLPNVLRMDAEEVDAIRAYVERGGRVYASKYTSLLETNGVLHDDFMLADVFGVRFEREELGHYVYAKPATDEVAALLGQQRYVTGRPEPNSLAGGLLRLSAGPDAEVLATLSLPYAHPDPGHWSDENWASIHSSPPWDDTDEPMIVRHRLGAGRAVYSAVDFETLESVAGEGLVAGLITELLDGEWSVQSDVDPHVWYSVHRGPQPDTIRVSLVNHPVHVIEPASLRIRPPAEGARFVSLTDLLSGDAIPYTTLDDGTLRCELEQLPELKMLAARYEEG
jgi:hypothetical protein